MVVGQEVGTPCVQDGEEPDLGSEPLRIGGNFDQSLGCGLEQQIEEASGSGERQRIQLVGHGEHDMEVVGVEQVALLRLDPTPAGLRLALRATTRSAGVIGEGRFKLAVGTLVLMSAQSPGTATLDSSKCLPLLKAEDGLEAFQKLPALCADDVGHLDGRAHHGRRGR